jgi:hypothetical protein
METKEQNLKTLVFEYTKLNENHYLLTLVEEENPKRFIMHPLQFKFVKNPEEHFKKHSGTMEVVKCKNI